NMATVRLLQSCVFAGMTGVIMGSTALPDRASAQAPAMNSGAPQVRDPGLRGGPPGAGGSLPGLGAAEIAFFQSARQSFLETDSGPGTIAGERGSGLGPRFNLNSCSGCHAQPAAGGTSPAVNPQVRMATLHGARNTVPLFITLHGPVREARFVRNPDGTPDG